MVIKMRISAKSRYALAALIHIGRYCSEEETVTVLSLSEKLGISKIYLEQVFSLLRRGGVVVSTKGAQGGYRLSRAPDEISVCDILSAIEISLFEKADSTVAEKAPEIERVLRNDVFKELDAIIPETTKRIKLGFLSEKAGQYGGDGYMYYL